MTESLFASEDGFDFLAIRSKERLLGSSPKTSTQAAANGPDPPRRSGSPEPERLGLRIF
ncbi:MAG: hypothetical protein AAB176_11370 [Pseudomonadota bacterium]